MDYNTYISSSEWTKKRTQRLEIDGHRCRLCDEDGTRYRLEIHHRPSSYVKIPNESVEHDLITLCSRCHELVTSSIRSDRYGRRELPDISLVSTSVTARMELSNGISVTALQIDIVGPFANAQRSDSGPTKQVCKIDETDFVKARQDGR